MKKKPSSKPTPPPPPLERICSDSGIVEGALVVPAFALCFWGVYSVLGESFTGHHPLLSFALAGALCVAAIALGYLGLLRLGGCARLRKAEEGDRESQFDLAQAYEKEGKNLGEAVRWYYVAADHGHLQAQLKLAQCFTEGVGTPRNLEKAVYWYRRAALQGNEAAQRALQTLEKLLAASDKGAS